MRYASRGRRRVAHLEAVEDAIGAEELTGAGVLGGPGENFVSGSHVDRRGARRCRQRVGRAEGGGGVTERARCAAKTSEDGMCREESFICIRAMRKFLFRARTDAGRSIENVVVVER